MKNRLAPRRSMSTAPGSLLRPVVALDVDGTLAQWHQEFLMFAARWLCRGDEYEPNWFSYAGGPFYRHMRVSKATYRTIKLAFRQSGLKRAVEPYEGARELAHAVRAAGAEVWVCTTRPYLRLDNIDPDTRFWLQHNRIAYDGVLFGDSKYRDLARLVGSHRVVAVLDDLPEQAKKAADTGLPTYMVERLHNQYHDVEFYGAVVTLESAAKVFVDNINKWKELHGV